MRLKGHFTFLLLVFPNLSDRIDGIKSLLINVFFFMPLTSRPVTWCLPGVGHALHGDLRGACNHARVPGRDDDGRGDGVCWTADI